MTTGLTARLRQLAPALLALPLLAAPGGPARPEAAPPGCYAADPASDWLSQPGRTLETMELSLSPDGSRLTALMRFSGDGPESPGAAAGVDYVQAFSCGPAPAERAGIADQWLDLEAPLCRSACDAGRVQLTWRGGAAQLWTDGFSLSAGSAPGCAAEPRLSTRGNVATGYKLVRRSGGPVCPGTGGA